MTVVDAGAGRRLTWPDDVVNQVICGDARLVIQFREGRSSGR